MWLCGGKRYGQPYPIFPLEEKVALLEGVGSGEDTLASPLSTWGESHGPLPPCIRHCTHLTQEATSDSPLSGVNKDRNSRVIYKRGMSHGAILMLLWSTGSLFSLLPSSAHLHCPPSRPPLYTLPPTLAHRCRV